MVARRDTAEYPCQAQSSAGMRNWKAILMSESESELIRALLLPRSRTRNLRFHHETLMLRSTRVARTIQRARPAPYAPQHSFILRAFTSASPTGPRSPLLAVVRQVARGGKGKGSHRHGHHWHESAGSARYALIPLIGTGPLLLDDGTEHQPQKHSLKTITDAVEHPDNAEFLIADGHTADDDNVQRSWLRRMIRLGRIYILEPLSTTLRFVHLACIFLPVIIAAPVLLLEYVDSGRDKRRGYRKRQDNERATTRWWYRLLVAQMERAGPTFIKVSFRSRQLAC